MGNCQAAEVAMVVVQHPENGKVDKMHWSVRANEVMGLNPGYYVALVVETPTEPGKSAKNHLKLLSPDDTLHIGRVYRLITFEEVINGFAEKKSVKLGNLLKESGVTSGVDNNKNLGGCGSDFDNTSTGSDYQQGGGGYISISKRHCGGGQWKPVLQSIAEF